MKYMHYNSSCSYTALAMLLEDKGIETEDVDIAIDIGLPWMFAEQDGKFISGPMLQGKKWFDLFLNPKGLCMNEEQIEKENIPAYLKEHGKCMLGAYVQGNSGKHAIVFYKYDGQYHFYNPIREGNDALAEIALDEKQLLQALDDITIVGSVLECPKSVHDKRELLDKSVLVLKKLYSEIEKFSKRAHSDEEYKVAMDGMFRALLLDGITMLEISGHNELADSFRKIQRDFLAFMKGDKKGILADSISLDELWGSVARYEELIIGQEEEYREVFTRDGVSQERIVPKHAPVNKGDYFKQILVILKTKDSPAPGEGVGNYIMQQRSLKAKYYAGMWDATGGSVKAGETPEEAAVREVKEELGLEISVADLVPAWEFIADWDDGTGLLFSVFGCRAEVPAEGFNYDKREVNDVKLAPFDEFYKCMMGHNDEAFGKELMKLEERL